MTLESRQSRLVGPGTAERIRVLVEDFAGPGYWDGFQRYMTDPDASPHEWRFGGALGFGGKVHFDGRRLYVSAYPEDMARDPHRENLVNALNDLLPGLLQ